MKIDDEGIGGHAASADHRVEYLQMTDASLLPILDTHQHLIYPEHSAYGWTAGLPALAERAFRLEDYLHACSGAGITYAIFMETSPDKWSEERQWIAPLIGQPGSPTIGMISSCRPEADGFERWLDGLRDDRIVGLRRICHVEADEFSQQARFIENLRRLAERQLTFDLCFQARQLPMAFKLVASCPAVTFILDHCGVPNVAGGELDPWREHIRALATLPNVNCKISGVLAYCKPGRATIDAVQPFVHHVIDCFGPDRLVWGSDWPVVNLTSDLANWVRITRALLADLSLTQQRSILFENATLIYGLRNRRLV
jgi:predicted TIM-barrel fold metal-dependent hydrolase